MRVPRHSPSADLGTLLLVVDRAALVGLDTGRLMVETDST